MVQGTFPVKGTFGGQKKCFGPGVGCLLKVGTPAVDTRTKHERGNKLPSTTSS